MVFLEAQLLSQDHGAELTLDDKDPALAVVLRLFRRDEERRNAQAERGEERNTCQRERSRCRGSLAWVWACAEAESPLVWCPLNDSNTSVAT